MHTEVPEPKNNYRILLILGLIALIVAIVWILILEAGKPADEPEEPSASSSYALNLDEVVPWGETVGSAQPSTRISSGSASVQPSSTSAPSATPSPTPSSSADSSATPSAASSSPSAEPSQESAGLVAYSNNIFDISESDTEQTPAMRVVTVREAGNPLELQRIAWQFDVPETEELVATWNGHRLEEHDIVGTGTILELIGENGLIADSAVVVVPGDVTGSGQLDDGQLALLKEAIDTPELLKGPYFLAGDLDGSGEIDIADLRLLAQAIN